jgi:hypothetical protein
MRFRSALLLAAALSASGGLARSRLPTVRSLRIRGFPASPGQEPLADAHGSVIGSLSRGCRERE